MTRLGSMLLLCVVVGCGPSALEVREAEQAFYAAQARKDALTDHYGDLLANATVYPGSVDPVALSQAKRVLDLAHAERGAAYRRAYDLGVSKARLQELDDQAAKDNGRKTLAEMLGQ